MIYIFVPFFSVTDCYQNYMQMINLKKLPEYFKSFKIFVIVPGVVLYSFFKKRADRLCALSMSLSLIHI